MTNREETQSLMMMLDPFLVRNPPKLSPTPRAQSARIAPDHGLEYQGKNCSVVHLNKLAI